MTRDEATEVLAKVCRGEIGLCMANHFWVRVRERAPGFTRQHVYQLLRKGTLHGDPWYDEERGNHKVKVRGTVSDFSRMEIVVAIAWLDDAVCVTIYDKE